MGPKGLQGLVHRGYSCCNATVCPKATNNLRKPAAKLLTYDARRSLPFRVLYMLNACNLCNTTSAFLIEEVYLGHTRFYRLSIVVDSTTQ